VKSPTLRKENVPLAAFLGALICGLGHIILGYTKRGIMILVGAAIVGTVSAFIIPWPYTLIMISPYWGWALYDLAKIVGRNTNTSDNY